MKFLRTAISFLLLAALLTGCGSTDVGNNDTTAPDNTQETTPAETEYAYPYPDTGFGGETITVLNMNDLYTMKCQFLREEATGDVLDDAIFNRNKLIEEKFEITFEEFIVEDTWEFKSVASIALNSIMANDNAYQIMFIPMKGATSIILEGGFVDLTTIEAVQLDQPWWYQSYNDKIMVNGSLYGGMSGAHTCVQDATRLMSFNVDIMEANNLELPYDAVRDGKWTLDLFNQYITKAANLNGDDSAAWRQAGKTIYGFSNNMNSVSRFMHAFGEDLVKIENGNFVYSAGSERFFDCVDRLKQVLTTADAKGLNAGNGDDMATDDGNPGYLQVFTNQRCLFADSEVNKLSSFRSLNFDYGILPYPKYDEAQDSYYADTWEGAPGAFIPVTSPDREKYGLLLDAIAYEGERTVTPAFREIAVEQKGLRDEDSIEMLEIVTDNLIPSCTLIYSFDEAIFNQCGTDVWTGTNSTASSIATNKTKIESQIEKLVESMQ